jgi:hypothetical protein
MDTPLERPVPEDYLSMDDPQCQHYGCEYYGGWECQSTRLLNRDADAMCIGPVQCDTCYYMGVDGKTRMCSVEKPNGHYCYYTYKSGWKSKQKEN